MSLEKLLDHFEYVRELPVEIPEVADVLKSLGIQDEITFCPDESIDDTILRGLYYQYTRSDKPYSEPVFCSLIVYSSKISKEWQRLVACKEMMHILDVGSEKTHTLEGLDGLLNRLLGPLSSEDADIFDIMATRDRLAIYQAIPLLFPEGARLDAIERVESGVLTIQDVADRACLPLRFVALALTKEWPELIKDICC